MRVTEITVTVGRVVNLGNYESLRLEVTNKAIVEEPMVVGERAYRLAHKELATAVSDMVARMETQMIPEKG